jgi:hypothetical protein
MAGNRRLPNGCMAPLDPGLRRGRAGSRRVDRDRNRRQRGRRKATQGTPQGPREPRKGPPRRFREASWGRRTTGPRVAHGAPAYPSHLAGQPAGLSVLGVSAEAAQELDERGVEPLRGAPAVPDGRRPRSGARAAGPKHGLGSSDVQIQHDHGTCRIKCGPGAWRRSPGRGRAGPGPAGRRGCRSSCRRSGTRRGPGRRPRGPAPPPAPHRRPPRGSG